MEMKKYIGNGNYNAVASNGELFRIQLEKKIQLPEELAEKLLKEGAIREVSFKKVENKVKKITKEGMKDG